ncbi:hypothetical protein [Paenibacillus sp. FSL R7-0337]|uniref:hypothetical protein n=1 Tax=Paenibacillus sp. FSL R7-0337 TaxID=1926588 RepID=UPI00096CE975|nr:hypothetical protein [Paenibacillus sp. FSL R7-0337]OMF85594.1 hypothetical protein BK147_31515 [Paenibacillus sp. FSL R7-0337]
MNVNTGKTTHKRGQRKNILDLPQRLLDRLTPAVLETSQSTQQQAVKAPQETLTLSKLFNRYYGQAAGAAERTLEDYRKHMNWFRRFLALEYSGLDNFVPNRDVIRVWISSMLMVQKLKLLDLKVEVRSLEARYERYMKQASRGWLESLRNYLVRLTGKDRLDNQYISSK